MNNSLNNLNINDEKLLAYCESTPKTISEIARELKITPKNVSFRVKKLNEMKILSVRKLGKGKKTYVETIDIESYKKCVVKILKEIKKRKGVSFEEFPKINFPEMNKLDMFRAIINIPYTTPKLIERKITLTKEGEKFIKEHSKK